MGTKNRGQLVEWDDECVEGSKMLGRRTFLKGFAVTAASLAGAASLAACSPAEAQPNSSGDGDQLAFADTVSWDGEYDVVVVGFGGAGAVAAKTAADEGASVLIVDKAPEGHEGGNTRYCGQMFVNGHGDVEGTKAYYRNLTGSLPLDDEVRDFFAENVANIEENYAKTYGIDVSEIANSNDPGTELFKVANFSPEYPEYDVNACMTISALHNGMSDAYMWKIQRKGVTDLSDKIDVWFESPGKKLIQDPLSKAVIGVQIERNKTTLNIRAHNGVVMTCGGFENNVEMHRDYLGVPRLSGMGTLYNTGDGIGMVMEAGADLWHMDATEGGSGFFGGAGLYMDEGVRGAGLAGTSLLVRMPSSVMLIGPGGQRYLNEAEASRHGKIYDNGEWKTPRHPARCYAFFDAADMAIIEEKAPLDDVAKSRLTTADTIEELAEAIDVKADGLKETIAKYNDAVANARAGEFGRPASTMRAVGDGPYYAIQMMMLILNTQGGPRRNVNCEVLDPRGEVIPHLYSAGEFGGITSNQYQGGGNMAENLIFGQVAGRNAAAKKDDLPALSTIPVESDMVYVLGKENDAMAQQEYETAANEHIGRAEGIGGDVVVKVTMDGDKIAAIDVLEQKETDNVGGEALKKLPDMVLKAQSTDIDAVSGATVTSTAFFAAVNEAVSQK